jgi:hypothetical protein
VLVLDFCFQKPNITRELALLIAPFLLPSQRCLDSPAYASFSRELLPDNAAFVEWAPELLCRTPNRALLLTSC